LFYGGAATVAYGVIGVLAAQHLGRLVAYSVIASSGLLLMSLGLRNEALTAPILFYLASSVLATAAFFMLNGLTERMRHTPTNDAADLAPLPDVTYVGFGVKDAGDRHSPSDEVGVAIPAAMA
jgi:multicomponent K+:H+ antiporter subunit D